MATDMFPAMDDKEIADYAKLVEKGIVQRCGKDWRRFLVKDIQRAVVSDEILRMVLSWRMAERISATEVQRITRACLARIVPEE